MERLNEFKEAKIYPEYIPGHEKRDSAILYISKLFGCMVYECPCGCEKETAVHFKSEKRGERTPNFPEWDLEDHGNGVISINPSVRMRGGCKAHYFIKQNKVEWCSDSGR